MRVKRTGFLEEEHETQSGDADMVLNMYLSLKNDGL